MLRLQTPEHMNCRTHSAPIASSRWLQRLQNANGKTPCSIALLAEPAKAGPSAADIRFLLALLAGSAIRDSHTCTTSRWTTQMVFHLESQAVLIEHATDTLDAKILQDLSIPEHHNSRGVWYLAICKTFRINRIAGMLLGSQHEVQVMT